MQLKAERVLEVLNYDPETGVFTWKAEPPRRGIKNRAGKPAGGKTEPRGSTCYLRVTIDAKKAYLHQLAWLLGHGEWPSDTIDHVNGDGLDNRLANLRLAGQSLNNANANRRRDNTSGHRGVWLEKKTGRWFAYISYGGRRRCLGRFGTREEAIEAYRAAALMTFGEFARHDDAGLASQR